jgi:hypothetical protein
MDTVYQLKVTLRGSKPPIWRRFAVPGSITLAKLHSVLQIVMGWTDTHLHEFILGRQHYGVPDPDYPSEDVKSERRVKLNQLLARESDRLLYCYDFGDGWEHSLVLEKVLPCGSIALKPRCLAGKRSCPPEDCGGIYGYYDLLKALGDPNSSDHEEMKAWVGAGFDPERFDLDEVNAILSDVR